MQRPFEAVNANDWFQDPGLSRGTCSHATAAGLGRCTQAAGMVCGAAVTVFMFALVPAGVVTWFVSAPRHAGNISPGQTLSEEQREVMNHLGLVLCKLSKRMAQANRNDK